MPGTCPARSPATGPASCSLCSGSGAACLRGAGRAGGVVLQVRWRCIHARWLVHKECSVDGSSPKAQLPLHVLPAPHFRPWPRRHRARLLLLLHVGERHLRHAAPGAAGIAQSAASAAFFRLACPCPCTPQTSRCLESVRTVWTLPPAASCMACAPLCRNDNSLCLRHARVLSAFL